VTQIGTRGSSEAAWTAQMMMMQMNTVEDYQSLKDIIN
jgi:hypothetical protein